MTLIAYVFGLLGTLASLVVLAGLLVRRRWRLWYAFALYLATLSGFGILFLTVPGAYNDRVWTIHENVMNGLRFGMALELAARTFGSFPGARSTLRGVLLAIVAVTLALVLAIPPAQVDYTTFVGSVQPRLLNGAIWLFTAIAALILWYRLPVIRIHKAVLLSYVPYLLVCVILLNALVSAGWEEGRVFVYLQQLAYLIVSAHWAWAVWAPLR